MKDGFLEFGAPLNYRYSWMSLGDLITKNVNVKAELKTTLQHPNADELNPFLGIMLRGQSYFANYGHLILIRTTGDIYLTVREDDIGTYHDNKIGQIDGYDNVEFTFFNLKINDTEISIKINDFTYNQKLTDLPYVFGEGKIIFIAGYCRAGIKNVEITEI